MYTSSNTSILYFINLNNGWDLIIIIIIIIIVGLDSAVATGYGLNGPGIESQWG